MTRNKIILIACAGLLPALVTPTMAFATCPPLASKVVTADTSISTTSGPFVTVANTTIQFVQGGKKASCVMVSFSADASAGTNEFMAIQAQLDGAIVCKPGALYFVASGVTGARAMNFFCGGVAPTEAASYVQTSFIWRPSI